MATVLRKIQIGKETTPGTEVDATTVLRMQGTLADTRTVEFVDLFSGIGKSFFFALIIALIACHNGLRTRGGATGCIRERTT